MGIFKNLFSKRDNQITNEKPLNNIQIALDNSQKTVFHLRGKPDKNGLYPSELVMLSLAEKYLVNETNYPNYLNSIYEITNPSKTLKNLQDRGYISVGGAKESLHYFKISELKEFASFLGVKVRGNKDSIISTLLEADDEKLSECVKDRTWIITDKGMSALNDNLYIQFFLSEHSYSLQNVGVDIWTVNEDVVNNPNIPYRDLIYRQLNKRAFEADVEIQKGQKLGSDVTNRYCECFRIMALFIEEEGRSYLNASDLYFQYIFKRINIHAGMKFLSSLMLVKDKWITKEEAIKRYYQDIQLLPFHKQEIMRLVDELNIDNDSIKDSLIVSFKRAKDSGIMTAEEAADFVILELSGEKEEAKTLSDKLINKAIKKYKL